jgi:DhnA family fructose-bisphosphate aldolase class Ia
VPDLRAHADVLDSPAALCSTYADITELRSREPQAIGRALAARRRRPSFLPADGRLMLIAADHPARGALAAQGRPTAMYSRTEMLDRLQTALARPGVDGLLATADIAEDLLLLGALEDKVVVASMNRGGLAGSAFELDDRMTGYDPAGVVQARFDAAKMLNRIDLDDPGTVAMLEASGRAITELARAGVIAMLEPFLSRRVDGAVRNDLSPDGVIKSVHIAQGLGATSAFTWLKLPVVAEMERVMDATTLPTLLLGGDPSDSPEETYDSWASALALPAVRGLVVGRTLLYPPDDDVAAAVDTAVSLVH